MSGRAEDRYEPPDVRGSGGADRNCNAGHSREPVEGTISPGDQAAAPGMSGTGEDICPQCKGTGTVGAEICPNCEGSGKVTKTIGGG